MTLKMSPYFGIIYSYVKEIIFNTKWKERGPEIDLQWDNFVFPEGRGQTPTGLGG